MRSTRPANNARQRMVPGPRAVGPPPLPTGLCAAWSHHAAELAVPLGAGLERWAESPSVQTMVKDGLLARLLPGIFLPPDAMRSAIDRALALGCALGGRLQSYHVIAGPSAAWVLLGGEPPAPAELISPAHRGPVAGTTVRHCRLRPLEVETIGGAPVTEPVRTAVDLLRFSPDHVAQPALTRLIASGHVPEGAVEQRLWEMERYPGAREARHRLRRMMLEPAETAA
ncbi:MULTISPECIES: hypothetical protein [unclassified Brachybacterium]|uniref:hypothetical protein n=1 Tax=unclassified Brachybacterium TaxID=2623841 RepID=UPI00360CD9C7